MVNSKKGDFVDDRKVDGSDREIQEIDEVFEGSFGGVSSKEMHTAEIGSTGPSIMVQGNITSSGADGSLTQGLRDIPRDERDEDLLLLQNDCDNSVLQWLQALDLQVIGACRADERLKPLLKLNVSCGVAEDRLLAHLSQHFEAPEVGMLARCLCMPLVSIRVGKVIKQGTLLCPTAARGNLNLTLLPSSDLCISFAGDDGCTERLATLGSNADNSAIVIEEIPADSSGRSFLIKLPCGQISYFWCSEKSKLLGAKLLAKMKDLLRRKPSLAKLTGISQSRLDCFAVHLRAYLLGSTASHSQANPFVSSTSSLDSASDPSELDLNAQVSLPSNHSHSQLNGNQALEDHSCYQSSLGPTSDLFEGGLPENLSSIKKGTREKFMQLGSSHCGLLCVDNLHVTKTSMIEVVNAIHGPENGKVPEDGQLHPSPLTFLDLVGKPAAPSSSNSLSLGFPISEVPVTDSLLFSPYYCWCPPPTSTLQYAVAPPHQPISWVESLSLPPLSSLLSAARSSSSLAPLKPPLNLSDVKSLDFPTFLPDPAVRVPLPISSFITGPTSQQIPTFTPLMCDPIVHVPVIDVCSSGEAYLVSAGHAISSTIPPLHSNIVNPLIPETESVLEKGARETLRMLLSSQTNPQLMEVLPAAFTSPIVEKHNIIIAGSRSGLYGGNRDVNAIANTIAAMGAVSLPHIAARCEGSNPDMESHSEGVGTSKGSCSSDDSVRTEESC